MEKISHMSYELRFCIAFRLVARTQVYPPIVKLQKMKKKHFVLFDFIAARLDKFSVSTRTKKAIQFTCIKNRNLQLVSPS